MTIRVIRTACYFHVFIGDRLGVLFSPNWLWPRLERLPSCRVVTMGPMSVYWHVKPEFPVQ